MLTIDNIEKFINLAARIHGKTPLNQLRSIHLMLEVSRRCSSPKNSPLHAVHEQTRQAEMRTARFLDDLPERPSTCNLSGPESFAFSVLRLCGFSHVFFARLIKGPASLHGRKDGIAAVNCYLGDFPALHSLCLRAIGHAPEDGGDIPAFMQANASSYRPSQAHAVIRLCTAVIAAMEDQPWWNLDRARGDSRMVLRGEWDFHEASVQRTAMPYLLALVEHFDRDDIAPEVVKAVEPGLALLLRQLPFPVDHPACGYARQVLWRCRALQPRPHHDTGHYEKRKRTRNPEGDRRVGAPKKHLRPDQLDYVIEGLAKNSSGLMRLAGELGMNANTLHRRLRHIGVPETVFARGSTWNLREFVLRSDRELKENLTAVLAERPMPYLWSDDPEPQLRINAILDNGS